MTYVKNQLFTKQKHPIYDDKSEARRKVVIVGRTLMRNFMIRIILDRFWCISYYHGPLQKNFARVFEKKNGDK